MGTCCRSQNKVEDTLQRHFEKLRILDLTYEDAENLLKVQGPLKIELMKKRFSFKFTTLFEDTLNLISKENWMKLCEHNFINHADNQEYIDAQTNLLSLVYEINTEYFKTGIKASLLVNLIPYFNKSLSNSTCAKSEKFFELISVHNLKYNQFKDLYKIFVRNALVCPLLAVRESLAKSSEASTREFLDEIDDYIKDNFNHELIGKFVNSLFVEFEIIRVNTQHLDGEDFNFMKNDFELIFRENEDLFNLCDLRQAYLARIV